MYHVGLEGDLEPVLQVVRELRQLRSFLAQCCRFHPDNMSNELTGLPFLERLIIVGHYAGDLRVGMPSMTELVSRNHNLQILELNPMGTFSDLEEVNDFFGAVKSAVNLKTLWCLSKFTDPYVKPVGDMIRENRSLESFKISLAPNTSLAPIAEAMRHNDK